MLNLEAGARRIEAPVLVDRKGATWTPGLIDVTLCYRDRPVLAESPPPGMSAELARELREAAARLAGARGQAGAFTVSFLADPASGEYRFQGTAPGLPAGVAVIEAGDESDLPALELHLCRGGTLGGDFVEGRGHALQVCLSSLDPEGGFAPSPGLLEVLRLPAGPGLRADAAVAEGALPDDGQEIARITAHGKTRAEALARLQRGLARTEVWLRDGVTDKAFLAEILDRPELIARDAPSCWLDRLVASGEHLPRRGAEVALLAAAVAGYEEELAIARQRFFDSAARGRPEVPKESGRRVELGYRGQTYGFRVARLDARRFRIEGEGGCLEVLAEPPQRTGRRFGCGERSWWVSLAAQGDRKTVEVDGIPHRIETDAGGIVRSPAPAVVVAVAVREGDEVRAGDPLAVLEAMKTETTLRARDAGRIRRVLVRRNVQVAAGGPLFMLEPADRPARPAAPAAAAKPLRFDNLVPPEDGRSVRSQSLAEIRRLMLGYDADPAAVERLIAGEAGAGTDGDVPGEEEILRTFADIGTLFRQPVDGADRHSAEEYLFTFLRDLDARGDGLPADFLDKLRRALAHYGVDGLDRSPELEESLFRIAVSHQRLRHEVPSVLAIFESWLERGVCSGSPELRELLDRVIADSQGRDPAVHDLAREIRYRCFDRPHLLAARERFYAAAEADLARLALGPAAEERAERIRALVECPEHLHLLLSRRFASANPGLRQALLEIMVRRYYRIRELGSLASRAVDGQPFALGEYEHRGTHVYLIASHTGRDRLAWTLDAVRGLAGEAPAGSEVVADLYVWRSGRHEEEDATAVEISSLLADAPPPEGLRRVAVALSAPAGTQHFTFRRDQDGALREERVYRGIHPMLALRLELWRLQNFHLERLEAPEGVYVFHGIARENPNDERLFAMAEVRDLTPMRDDSGRVVQLPQLERMLMEALAGVRRFQSRRAAPQRLQWNRVQLNVWPPVDLRPEELNGIVRRLAPLSEGLGLEKVAVRCRIPERDSGELREWVLEISSFEDGGMVLRFRKPAETPLKPLREYAQKVVELRRRGLAYPYELIKRLAPSAREAQADLPAGEFVEHDLDGTGDRLVPVHRPYGGNTANLVAGVVRNFTDRHPEGMARVILLSDPSRGMGSLAEPECRRIIAALDLAERMRVPLEWFPLSAGARIAMDSGTENMDWIARVLRRLVEFTQGGGEVNLVVAGVNVGAQPYWNAEATMLMHTRGILIMTPEGSMVLTGKEALDYSGGVSAEDNQGIGGYERIMGPNGQAQYVARDLGDACRVLLRYYEHAYVAPGERFPRPAPTRDPRERDVRGFPHGGEFGTLGEVFSPRTNPGRKQPFEIRRVMAAVVDQDQPPLERWYGMHDAEIAVVWDAHLGGHAVCLLGFESKPLPRLGWVPLYGPEQWTGGTLFPMSSKKVARAINAASGSRPLVVLANLSGFDGSPESMRFWQLEYGAEIGRAVVNFKGPIVFCVVSRYHGGAFVVFSNALHDNLEVAALEGSHASVIGGAPAAAVVFAREVERRTRKEPRIVELETAIADPERGDKARLRAQLAEALEAVRSEQLGEVAEEFDRIHNIHRAQQVGSIHHVIAPERLRPYLIAAVERGMDRELAALGQPSPVGWAEEARAVGPET